MQVICFLPTLAVTFILKSLQAETQNYQNFEGMLHAGLLELLASETPVTLAEKLPVTILPDSDPQQASRKDENAFSPFGLKPHSVRVAVDDDFFEDGDIHRHMYLQNIASDFEEHQHLTVSTFRCHIAGCTQLFDTLDGYEHHYNSIHRNVCSTCKRSFPSNRLLEIHILEWHDSLFEVLAEKQCMYECLVEGCGLKFKASKERKEHLIRTHSYPVNFRFNKSKEKERVQEKRRPQNNVLMEVSASTALESSESMDLSLTPEEESLQTVAGQEQGTNFKPKYSYKVPSSICFGQGSVRGFRGRRKK